MRCATTATLGGLANAGIRNGSTLGTGVRQILLDLQNPTEKFKKVMNELASPWPTST